MFNRIGRLSLQGGEDLTTLGLKKKLEAAWGFSSFRVIPAGRGFFQVFFKTMAEQSLTMSIGTISLRPGLVRVSRWVPDFNPETQRQSNAQVWIRIVGLPIEYWRPTNLCSIARAAGIPLKIDTQTLKFENCIFARLLVDVDLRNELPEKVLVKRKNSNFFVSIVYEKVPNFCPKYCSIGHDIENCRREDRERTQERKNGSNQPEGWKSGREEPTYWKNNEGPNMRRRYMETRMQQHRPTTANVEQQIEDQRSKSDDNNQHPKN